MKIALISDLHGTMAALSTVLRDIESAGADRTICLGDVATLGSSPNDAIDTLRGMGCPCIMGNHDEFLLEPDLIDTYSENRLVRDAVDWCRERLTPENLEYVRTFLRTYEVDLGDGHTMLAFHGSPTSHMEILNVATSGADLDRHLAGKEYAVMAGGHTHAPMVRRHLDTYFVNPGSVGMPFREVNEKGVPRLLSGAEYALIDCVDGDIRVELRRIRVDKNALLKELDGSDNPLRDGLEKAYLGF
jgi:predicted phosphodiesterase